ncbi:MAG: hypothetical protein H7329_11270 [Opitutaceae bacterium]|nr:hypothetical protein [Cytophagales bacterium]
MLNFQSHGGQPVIINSDIYEICLSRNRISFFEDSTARLNIGDISKGDGQTFLFNESSADDLENENLTSAYWLKFYLVNKSDHPFRVEIFDFDIDQISFFTKGPSGEFIECKAGYAEAFDDRQIRHKNVSFYLSLTKDKETCIYMRFYSSRKNVLEPIIRSYDRIIEYSLNEYMLFGIFYGLIY